MDPHQKQTIQDRIDAYRDWRNTHPDTRTNEEKNAIRKIIQQRFVDWKNKQLRSAKLGSPLQRVYKRSVTPLPVYTGSIRKSNGGKLPHYKKGGKAEKPTDNNRSALPDPANLGFIQQPPGEYYDDDDFDDDDFVDDDFVDDDDFNEFVRDLYSTIQRCLRSAEQYVEENHDSINIMDGFMSTENYVCRDLVGLLQWYSDTIGRLTGDDKPNIYSDVFKDLNDNWYKQRESHHGDGADVNILKFYRKVRLDILLKIRQAFGIYQTLPPLPLLLPLPPQDVGGKRRKKQRMTRKKKGSRGVIGIPATLTTPSRKQRKTKRPNQSRKQKKTKRPKQTRKQKKSKK
jgi:hypothetical protein